MTAQFEGQDASFGPSEGHEAFLTKAQFVRAEGIPSNSRNNEFHFVERHTTIDRFSTNLHLMLDADEPGVSANDDIMEDVDMFGQLFTAAKTAFACVETSGLCRYRNAITKQYY